MQHSYCTSSLFVVVVAPFVLDLPKPQLTSPCRRRRRPPLVFLLYHRHRYSVVMWTSLGSRRVSFPVARHGHRDLDTGMLHLILRPALLGCLEHGFDVAAITFDGASINRAYGADVCTMPASTWYNEDDFAAHPDIDFTFKIAMLHPYHGRDRPIFLIWDAPHWLKKLRNFLFSSNPGGRVYDKDTEMPTDTRADGKIPRDGPHLTPARQHSASAAAIVLRPAVGPPDSVEAGGNMVSVTGCKLHEAMPALTEHGGEACAVYEEHTVSCSVNDPLSALNAKAVQQGDPRGLVGAIGGRRAADGKRYVYHRLGESTHVRLPAAQVDAAMGAADHKLCGSLLGIPGQFVDLRQLDEVETKPAEPGGQFLSKFFPVNLTMIQRGVGRGAGSTISYSNELTVNVFKKEMFQLQDRSAKMNVRAASLMFSRKAQVAIRFAGDRGHLKAASHPHESSRLPDHQGYAGLSELQRRVDDMWDIFNCSIKKGDPAQSKGAIWDPATDPQLEALLDHLDWFQSWTDRLKRCPELTPSQRLASFIPRETWLETQGLCLGMVALARHYVKPTPADSSPPAGYLRCVVLGRITSDPCENHVRPNVPRCCLVTVCGAKFARY